MFAPYGCQQHGPFESAEPSIPKHANKRTLPSWLFDARLFVRDRQTPSRPDAILVTPIPIKSKPPSTPHLQQPEVQHLDLIGNCRAHKLKANKREVHLIEVKYCEDTRPGHQLQASSKQTREYAGLKNQNVTLHTILLGVGDSIYTSNVLHHLEKLGLDSQRVHTTAPKLHSHSVHFAHKLTRTRLAPIITN